MSHLLILGEGYTGGRLRAALDTRVWQVTGTAREAREGVLSFDDEDSVAAAIKGATHILSSIPPAGDRDPVLDRYGTRIAAARAWRGYLSSTGVYGDWRGAWVDESAPIGGGRRTGRSDADERWQGMPGCHIFRLPGIYGPGRSPFARLRAGTAKRIGSPGQVFSRVHVDDIVGAVMRAMTAPAPGIYNIADDEPAPAHEVTAFAAQLMGVSPPPLQPLDQAELSPAARGFYSENRRVANGRMKRVLGASLRYPDYRGGLRAVWREEQG